MLVSFSDFEAYFHYQIDSKFRNAPGHVYHPTCKESVPSQCSVNEWIVMEGSIYVEDRKFTVDCGNYDRIYIFSSIDDIYQLGKSKIIMFMS